MPSSNVRKQERRLVQTDGLAHGGFYVQRFDVLPVLLEQRHEEVDAWKREIRQLATKERTLAHIGGQLGRHEFLV